VAQLWSGKKGKPLSNFKNFAVWVLGALLLIALFNLFQGPAPQDGTGSEIAYSRFLSDVDSGNVSEVVIQGEKVSGIYTDGRRFQTIAPQDPSLVDTLKRNNVSIAAKPADDGSPSLFGILISWFPMLLLIAVAARQWALASPRRSC
jgi:cell division protease FtsH